jgi:hypothetical protein
VPTKEAKMDSSERMRLFDAHRDAEAAYDFDAILDTFSDDLLLGDRRTRLTGRDSVRAAYEVQFFTAFPDLAPQDEGIAVGAERYAPVALLG